MTGLRAMDSEDWQDVGRKSLLGAEHVADGGSGGGYFTLHHYAEDRYAQRSREMQKMADEAGVGFYNWLIENGIKATAGAMTGRGPFTSLLTNGAVHYLEMEK